jgi:hypothetical protein
LVATSAPILGGFTVVEDEVDFPESGQCGQRLGHGLDRQVGQYAQPQNHGPLLVVDASLSQRGRQIFVFQVDRHVPQPLRLVHPYLGEPPTFPRLRAGAIDLEDAHVGWWAPAVAERVQPSAEDHDLTSASFDRCDGPLFGEPAPGGDEPAQAHARGIVGRDFDDLVWASKPRDRERKRIHEQRGTIEDLMLRSKSGSAQCSTTWFGRAHAPIMSTGHWHFAAGLGVLTATTACATPRVC